MSRMKQYGFALASIVLSTFFGLAIAEVSVRLLYLQNPWTIRNFTADPVNQQHSNFAIRYDPVLGYIARPEYRDGVNFTHGIMGIRLNYFLGPNDSTPPLRTGGILAVGDSFVYGSEVKEDESWPAQLEKILGVVVNNGGAGGYGFDQAVLRAEQLMDVVHPEMIIVGCIPNCTGRNEFSVNTGLVKPYFDIVEGKLELKNTPIPEYRPTSHHIGRLRSILGYSYAIEWAAERLGLKDVWQIQRYETVQVHNRGAEVNCLLWRRLQAEAGPRNIKLALVAQYSGPQIPDGSDNTREVSHTEDWLNCAKEAGFVVVDSYPVLRQLNAENKEAFWNLWVQEPYDTAGRHTGHMSAAGNRFTAELLAQAIRSELPDAVKQ